MEPVPIEDRIRRSSLVAQCVVVGQDCKSLAVLVIPDMDIWTDRGFPTAMADLAQDPQAEQLLRQEVQSLIHHKHGFKRFEYITACKILSQPFVIGEELTNLMKLRRHIIHEKYQSEIAALYN